MIVYNTWVTVKKPAGIMKYAARRPPFSSKLVHELIEMSLADVCSEPLTAADCWPNDNPSLAAMHSTA